MEHYMEQAQETTIASEQNKALTRRSLKVLRLQLSEAIFELAGLNRIAVDVAYTNLLWQIYAACKREIQRKLTNDAGTDEYFDQLTTTQLAALHIGDQLLEYMDRTPKEFYRPAEREAVVLIGEVVDVLGRGIAELSEQFPPLNLDQLPKKLYFSFFNLTVGQAYELAADIKAMRAGASETC
jgi:hypothetical protein